MKRILTSTALALVLGLAAGVSLTAAPAEAACVRAAALDLNGDNWIDGDERDMARSAGFQAFDSNGDLFVSADEMNRCLNGSASAFRWLSGANPNYASAGGYSGPTDTMAPSATYAPPSTMTGYYPSQDRGAAFDTPAPVAREAALAYLRSKVENDPRYAPRVASGYTVYQTPQILYDVEPAVGTTSAALEEFARIDVDNDGLVTAGEYLDYMTRLAPASY